MKLIPALLVGLTAAFVLAGCYSHGMASTSQPYVLKLTGTPGQAFHGTLKEKGKTRAISGVVPAEYQVKGRNVKCELTQDGAEGELYLDVMLGGKKLAGYRGGGGPQRSIRFKAHDGWMLDYDFLTEH